MTMSTAAVFVFLFLFVCYGIQLLQIWLKVRRGWGANASALLDEIWIYLGLSLIIPIAVSLLPELLGEGIKSWIPRPSSPPATAQGFTPSPQGMAIFLLEIMSRFLASYLVTIVTLELSLQAQVLHAQAANTWGGLLLMNLGLDIASIVVIRLFMAIPPSSNADALTLATFGIFLIPTVLTGAIVVAATYATLRPGQNHG
jgi:hypothetical protein